MCEESTPEQPPASEDGADDSDGGADGQDGAGQTDETEIELFYRAPLTPYVTIQPDLQYIANPSGQGRDAFVASLRFELVL